MSNFAVLEIALLSDPATHCSLVSISSQPCCFLASDTAWGLCSSFGLGSQVRPSNLFMLHSAQVFHFSFSSFVFFVLFIHISKIFFSPLLCFSSSFTLHISNSSNFDLIYCIFYSFPSWFYVIRVEIAGFYMKEEAGE